MLANQNDARSYEKPIIAYRQIDGKYRSAPFMSYQRIDRQ
jgi:hypothetical protein